jgi:hypothetical protein
MFTDIARDIARGEPPDWLVPALEELARHVATAGLNEERDPKRAELRERFRRVHIVAKKMDRTLDAIRDGLVWIPVKDIDNLRTIRGALRTAIEVCDRALKRISAGGGRTRARHQAEPTARVICAIIVIEAWATVHGKPLRGGHNERIGEICMKYWRTCGGPPIGKGSKGEGPNNWRRPMEKALSDNSALGEYVRSELRRGAAQNSPKNIGNPVP